MNQLAGLLNSWMGRSFYKLLVMRRLGEVTDPQTGKKVVHWRLVRSHYFSPSETEWKMNKTKTFELHLQNEIYGRGEGHLFAVDFDTNQPISLSGSPQVVYSPEELTARMDTRDITAAVTAAKGFGMGWLAILAIAGVCIALGMFIGISPVGQAINHALAGNSTQAHAAVLAVIG